MNAAPQFDPTTNQHRTLLHLLIQEIVDHPDEVRVGLVEGSQCSVFEVRTHPEDIRRVVGRKGRTADAAREILFNIGSKARRRYLLEVLEASDRLSSDAPRLHQSLAAKTPIGRATELLSLIAAELVDAPEAVDVQAVEGRQTVIFVLDCAPDDVCRLIGRKGRTAQAIRALMLCLSGKAGRRYHLELVDPRGTNRPAAGSAIAS